MKKIVMIFLDAFSSRYFDDSPFFSTISNEKFFTTLRPMFAFQGIGAALFTGTSVSTNKIWCDYVLKTDGESTPRLLKYILKLCDILPDDNLNKYSRFVLNKLFKQKYGTPNIIPPDLIDYFELKLKNSYTENRPLGNIVTLFDQLRNYEKKFYVLGLSASIYDPTSKDILRLLKKDYDLFLVKFNSLDRLGHKHGPGSKIIQKRIKEIDNIIREIIESNSRDDIDFIFFSDHGMVPVSETINIFDILDKLSVKIIDDYILFIGSTVISFWFKNDNARKIIMNALKYANFGNIITEGQLNDFGISNVENGELIFILEEGKVFSPDFYRVKVPPKGMHGYAFQKYDTPILSICTHDPSIIFENRDTYHIDIMPTVLELLGLPIPSTCEGKSLIKKN